jgi:NTE family protein
VQSELFGGIGLRFSHSSAVSSTIFINYGEKLDEYYQVEKYYSYDTPDKTKFDFIKGTFKIEKLTLNSKQYATRGRNQLLAFSVYSGVENHIPGTTAPSIVKSSSNHLFFTAFVHNESYHRIIGRRFWLGVMFDGYWSNQEFFNNYHATVLSLNQFNPSPHSNSLFFSNYRTNQYFAVGLTPLIDITKNIHIRIEACVYQPVKIIEADLNNKAFYGEEFANRWATGSASVVYRSPIGPMAATVAYYPSNGGKELYFSLTFGYSLFNPRVFDN